MFVLLIFLSKREKTDVNCCFQKKDKRNAEAGESWCQSPGFHTYHVSEVGHSKTVGLDALVSHDVVHQHHFAVVEPDLPAESLL